MQICALQTTNARSVAWIVIFLESVFHYNCNNQQLPGVFHESNLLGEQVWLQNTNGDHCSIPNTASTHVPRLWLVHVGRITSQVMQERTQWLWFQSRAPSKYGILIWDALTDTVAGLIPRLSHMPGNEATGLVGMSTTLTHLNVQHYNWRPLSWTKYGVSV